MFSAGGWDKPFPCEYKKKWELSALNRVLSKVVCRCGAEKPLPGAEQCVELSASISTLGSGNC